MRSICSMFLAVVLIPNISQADIYRLTVEGTITSRIDVPGLPSPVIGAVGAPFSVYWEIDDTVVPQRVPGQFVFWQSVVTALGFQTPLSSRDFADNLRSQNNIFVESGSTRSYYSIEAGADLVDLPYFYFAGMTLNGAAFLDLDEIGQLDPGPLSQWTPPAPFTNVFSFSTCPTTSGGCTTIIGAPASVTFELILDTDDPSAQLEELSDLVLGIGPGSSLADKIAAAQAYFDASDIESACGILNAFLNQVSAQSGKKLDAELASQFMADANAIIQAIECDAL